MTLQKRMNELVNEYIDLNGTFNGAHLARTCGLGRASVSEWLSGGTKSIQGKYLSCVARYFNSKNGIVNPDWLAGTGEKYLKPLNNDDLPQGLDLNSLEQALLLVEQVIDEIGKDYPYKVKAYAVRKVYAQILNGDITQKEILSMLEIAMDFQN